MPLSKAIGPGAEASGAVVRKVGERRPAVGDAVAKGAPTFVRDLQGGYAEALYLELARFQTGEGPTAPQSGRRYWEVRRGHCPSKHRFYLPFGLGGGVEGDLRPRGVAGSEEREPLCVVPVHVPE